MQDGVEVVGVVDAAAEGAWVEAAGEGGAAPQAGGGEGGEVVPHARACVEGGFDFIK